MTTATAPKQSAPTSKPSLLTPETAEHFTAGLRRMKADALPKWGSMTPIRFLAHNKYAIEMTLGEIPDIPDISNFITRQPVLQWFMLNVMPMPKGKIKAPEFMVPEPTESYEKLLEQNVSLVKQLADVIAAEPNRQGRSPLFGDMPMSRWSRMHAVHMRHHLEQFGVEV